MNIHHFSYSHHAPHNVVLNCPFARTIYSFVHQSIFYWNKLIVCASSVHDKCTFYLISLVCY